MEFLCIWIGKIIYAQRHNVNVYMLFMHNTSTLFCFPCWTKTLNFMHYYIEFDCVYQQAHKHIPEMSKYSGLGTAPIFQPAIAAFDQGMVVSVPLHYAWLKEGATGKDIHAAIEKHYKGSKFISVMPAGEIDVKEAGLLTRGAFLRPDTLKNTNNMELFVFYNDDVKQALLCARLDNLGKGASGAAVQNLNIALGVDETTGL